MKVIRRRALCIEQTKSGPLYLLTLRADEIFDVAEARLVEHVESAMARVAPHCRWTSGVWDELSLQWNDVENTSRNQRVLTNFLVRVYLGGGAE